MKQLEYQDESFFSGLMRSIKDSIEILRVKNFTTLLFATSLMMAVYLTTITILSQILRPSLLLKLRQGFQIGE